MNKDHYYDNLLLKDALQIYFSKYHFKNGGYNDKYFKIKVGPFYFPFPNNKARIEAVKRHDVHHIVTGYKADWRGEIEIAGWELSSGCGKYFMAWYFNTGSFFIGLFLFPKALYHAFIEGKSCRNNFYDSIEYDQEILNKILGEIRTQMFFEKTEGKTLLNNLSFVGYFLLSLLHPLFYILLICAIQRIFF